MVTLCALGLAAICMGQVPDANCVSLNRSPVAPPVPELLLGEFSCNQTLPVFFWDGRVMWGRGNFGDEFNRDLVSFMLNVPPSLVKTVQQNSEPPRLFAVGSVLSYARAGDHVWGSGFHEKGLAKIIWPQLLKASVHAARGPLGCAIMVEHGVGCGRALGDPGLLGGCW
jgi:pyruvyltransferase